MVVCGSPGKGLASHTSSAQLQQSISTIVSDSNLARTLDFESVLAEATPAAAAAVQATTPPRNNGSRRRRRPASDAAKRAERVVRPPPSLMPSTSSASVLGSPRPPTVPRQRPQLPEARKPRTPTPRKAAQEAAARGEERARLPISGKLGEEVRSPTRTHAARATTRRSVVHAAVAAPARPVLPLVQHGQQLQAPALPATPPKPLVVPAERPKSVEKQRPKSGDATAVLRWTKTPVDLGNDHDWAVEDAQLAMASKSGGRGPSKPAARSPRPPAAAAVTHGATIGERREASAAGAAAVSAERSRSPLSLMRQQEELLAALRLEYRVAEIEGEHGPQELYSDGAILQREALRQDSSIRRAIALIFGLYAAPRYTGGSDAGVLEVDEEGYCGRLYPQLQVALGADIGFSAAEREREARAEWARDSGGKTTLGLEEFSGCLFELADLWTPSLESGAYCELLYNFLRALAVLTDQGWRLRPRDKTRRLGAIGEKQARERESSRLAQQQGSAAARGGAGGGQRSRTGRAPWQAETRVAPLLMRQQRPDSRLVSYDKPTHMLVEPKLRAENERLSPFMSGRLFREEAPDEYAALNLRSAALFTQSYGLGGGDASPRNERAPVRRNRLNQPAAGALTTSGRVLFERKQESFASLPDDLSLEACALVADPALPGVAGVFQVQVQVQVSSKEELSTTGAVRAVLSGADLNNNQGGGGGGETAPGPILMPQKGPPRGFRSQFSARTWADPTRRSPCQGTTTTMATTTTGSPAASANLAQALASPRTWSTRSWTNRVSAQTNSTHDKLVRRVVGRKGVLATPLAWGAAVTDGVYVPAASKHMPKYELGRQPLAEAYRDELGRQPLYTTAAASRVGVKP